MTSWRAPAVDELHQVDLLERVAGALDREAADAELRSQLVRAWLAGYGRAIEDFRAHANRQTGTRLSRGLRRILHRRDRANCA